MAVTDLGKVSLSPKGTWNNTLAYEKLDLVYYQGFSYLAKQDVPAGTALTNDTYWEAITGSHNHDDRYYTESEVDDLIEGRALHISMASTSTLGQISNSAITTTMRVVNIVWSNPENVTSNVTWNTDTAGKLVLSGTLAGATSAEIDLIDFG